MHVLIVQSETEDTTAAVNSTLPQHNTTFVGGKLMPKLVSRKYYLISHGKTAYDPGPYM